LKWAEVNGEWCELIEIGVREWTMVLVNWNGSKWMENGISSLKWTLVNIEWCELIETGVSELRMVLVNSNGRK
jgi:hypothetical protein